MIERQVHRKLPNQKKSRTPVLVIRRKIHLLVLVNHRPKVRRKLKSRKVDLKSESVKVPPPVPLLKNPRNRNRQRKSHIDTRRKTRIRNLNDRTTTLRRRNQNIRKKTIITTRNANRHEVEITNGEISTGSFRTTKGRGNVQSARDLSVTSRGLDGEDLATDPKSVTTGGTGNHTTGRVRSGKGLTTGVTTTETISMFGLGTSGDAREVPAAPDTAGEQQVTNATGCIFDISYVSVSAPS